ncbi:MAG: hypothetical protein IOC63_05575 [Methylobacterium sp.]|nr:hypothetical protein [Methylobacterium sp.]
MPHYLVVRHYVEQGRTSQLDDTFTLAASSDAQAISEAKIHGPTTMPTPDYFVLYRVTGEGRRELWNSRQEGNDA